jgi:hypothetical protein
MQFGDYWFDSGEPSVLAEFMKKQHVIVDSLRNTQVQRLFAVDSQDPAQPVNYLFHNGYLSIRPNGGADIYVLDYPNHEVSKAMSSLMMWNVFGNQVKAGSEIGRLSSALASCNADEIVSGFNRLLPRIPYDDYARANSEDIADRYPAIPFGEWLYRAMLLAFLEGAGVRVRPEPHDCLGGGPLVVERDGRTWVIGITVAKTADDVIQAADGAARKACETECAGQQENSVRLGIAIDDGRRRIGGYRLNNEPFRAVDTL